MAPRQRGRFSRRTQLARTVPPAIVATQFGYRVQTTERHAVISGATWSAYPGLVQKTRYLRTWNLASEQVGVPKSRLTRVLLRVLNLDLLAHAVHGRVRVSELRPADFPRNDTWWLVSRVRAEHLGDSVAKAFNLGVVSPHYGLDPPVPSRTVRPSIGDLSRHIYTSFDSKDRVAVGALCCPTNSTATAMRWDTTWGPTWQSSRGCTAIAAPPGSPNPGQPYELDHTEPDT